METSSVGVNITDGELRIGESTGGGNNASIRLGSTGTNVDTHAVLFYDGGQNQVSLIIVTI